MIKIKVLGFCASPRKGNSEYILSRTLTEAKKLPYDLKIKNISLKGKKISPCISCFKCKTNKGECILKDDFKLIKEMWLEADVIIYSVPIHHLFIPGKFKCFIERLKQSLNGYYQDISPRHLKVIGNIVQGAHLYGGQEITLVQLILHEILMNCIPISGNSWESYLGAAAWTFNSTNCNTLKEKIEENDRDTNIAFRAAFSLVKRSIETAAILKAGGLARKEDLKKDLSYQPFLQRICEN